MEERRADDFILSSSFCYPIVTNQLKLSFTNSINQTSKQNDPKI